MDEEWRPVVGWEGWYEVSDLGRVRRSSTRRVRTLVQDKDGYHQVQLSAGIARTPRTTKVHRLVAGAFLENPGGLPTVNHKDGDKLNNSKANLEWMSHADNIAHAHRTGLRDLSGERNGRAMLNSVQVRVIRRCIEIGLSKSCTASVFGVSPRTVGNIGRRATWSHV